MTRPAAWTSCLGEAVERYAGGVWSPDELEVCRRADLDGRSLDPRDLVLYRPEQYNDLPYASYSDESKLAWIRARSLIHDDPVWVPALSVFMEYEVTAPEEYLFPITSNGLAAGPTLCDAVLSAIYEVVERDALLISWLNRLPAKSYDATRHPDPDVRQLALSWARRGVRLGLFELPTDHPVSVVLGIAFQEGGFGGPYATIGLGANLNVLKAARGAALEVGQVRPAFRERARVHDADRVRELVADPSGVKSLEDHALLYADASTADAFEFLDGESADWPEISDIDTASALKKLLEYFTSVEQEVIYVNLTPPDLEPFGLFTVRAILPGFQPIWFGRQERRLGGTRLFDLPRRLGLSGGVATLESLNPLPHPLA